MTNNNNIGFLFGAGLSQAAGNMGTAEITNFLLKENAYYNPDNLRWAKNPEDSLPNNDTSETKGQVLLLLNILYNKYNKKTNYEELANALLCIRDTSNPAANNNLGLYNNPLCETFIKELAYNPNLTNTLAIFTEKKRLEEFAQTCVNYITDVVCGSIKKFNLNREECYRFLFDAIADKNCKNIFCLNHDTLLEQYFDQQKALYIDGFSALGDKLWDVSLFNNDDTLKLFKLHGSVDWAYCAGNPVSNYTNYWCKGRGADTTGNVGMLIGTTNKIVDNIAHDIFTELFILFHNRLKELNTLVTYGYSFRDHAVNMQVINWMFNDPSHMLIVFDINDEEQFLESALPNLWRCWKEWKEKDCLQFNKVDGKTPIDWAKLKVQIQTQRKK